MGLFALVTALLTVGLRAQTVDNLLTNGLFEPFGVAVDTDNTTYITDSAHNRIVKYVPDTGIVTSLAGDTGFIAGFANGLGSFARFSDPKGIVLARGGIVVADSANHCIRFISFGGVVTTLAGAAVDVDGDGIPDGDFVDNVQGTNARFSYPSGITADSLGNLYVADTQNNRIRKVDIANNVTTFAGGSQAILYQPAALTFGDTNDLWVADTRNHSIKAFTNGVLDASRIIGSNSRNVSGTNDSLFASAARFNQPRGLLWMGAATGLLVADTANHTLRRVYYNAAVTNYSVETLSGTPGVAGFVNGSLGVARLNSPISVTRDTVGGLLIVDSQNNAVRVMTLSAPRPAVSNPTIGWVDFIKDQSGSYVTSLQAVSSTVFNNDVNIQILAGETGVETYFTVGNTPSSPIEDTIPSPSKITGTSPANYKNGVAQSQFSLSSIVSPQTDITMKTISTQDGRKPSQVITARFQFKTANPSIDGDNPASFIVNDETSSAKLYYTTNGSDPTFDLAVNPASVGPITPGTTLSLDIGNGTVIFKVKAFKSNYGDSEIVSKSFSATNFTPNQITFGFDGGEASSQFVGAPGSVYVAPVTLSVLAAQKMYSLQFNLNVTNLSGAPAVVPTANMTFKSMLMKPLPGSSPVVYITIPNAMSFLVSTGVGTNVAITQTNVTLLTTNTSANLLSVGWLERSGETNLFDTGSQDLISFSQARDTLFLSSAQKVILGAYAFQIPATAPIGSKYQIQIGRPSATADGISQDVFIQATTNGSLSVGAINAIKQVTVGTNAYLVGDVAPFRWFNAGDFGDTNLLNNDVLQTFEEAIGINSVISTGSDFYDAMDSANANTAALYSGDDSTIDAMALGDGSVNIADVFVTFRRSLDPSRSNYLRFWQDNGTGTYVRVAVLTTNTFRGRSGASMPAIQFSNISTKISASHKNIAKLSGPVDPASVAFSADSVPAASGQTLTIPIRARITGGLPIRVMMFNLNVVAKGAAPPISSRISFAPAAGLGNPVLTDTRGPYNYSAAWLNSAATGVSGDAIIGTATVTLPAGVPANSTYAVHLQNVSSSPNGLGVFPQTIADGFITVNSTETYSLNDGIPDSWRVRYFGSVNDPRAAASADPDGDGASNSVEFFNGTNPTVPDSAEFATLKPVFQGLDMTTTVLDLAPWVGNNGLKGFVLRWPTVGGKNYILESSSDLNAAGWNGVVTNSGNDTIQGVTVPNNNERLKVFRLRKQ